MSDIVTDGASAVMADAGGSITWWMWAAGVALALAALTGLVWWFFDGAGEEAPARVPPGPGVFPPGAVAGAAGPRAWPAPGRVPAPVAPRPGPAVAVPVVSGGPRPGPRHALEPAPEPEPHGAEDPERRHLVMLCIDLADRLRAENPALQARLHRGLAEVGVVAVEPDGEPFDRGRHDAVGSEAAAAADQDRVVARTELLGYLDNGGVLRRPEVVVYAWEGA